MTKRKRFEIFKRDGFRCVYCGNSPPAVVLEAEHVIPQSKGGGDESTNLVTSCFTCNRGKSDKSLSSVPEIHIVNIAVEQEKLDQLKAISRLAIARRKQEAKDVDMVLGHWHNLSVREPTNYILSQVANAASRFLKRLSLFEVLDSADISFRKFHSYGTDTSRLKYFCGVCHKKIRDREERNATAIS